MSRAAQSGLTVMEMIVAMGIVAMAMALGMQALMQWNKAQERFAASERRGREIQLGEAWVRSALQSRLSRADEGLDGEKLDALEGDARTLSFVTLSPIGGRRGIPARQQWRIAGDRETPRLAIENVTELRLPEGRQARFIYVDAEGEVQDRWPPRGMDAAPFPALVGIETRDGLWLEAGSLRPLTVPHENVDE